MTPAHTWDAIEVLLVTGEKVRVVADAVIGNYAVHRALWGGAPVVPAWTVTHISSCSQLWITAKFEDAVKVANFLMKEKLVPETLDAFMQWRQRVSQPNNASRATLWAALQSIAPRYYDSTLAAVSKSFGVADS